MFKASISQVAVDPNSVVVVPIRPYTDAVVAAASSRANFRITVAATSVATTTDSGVNGAIAATNSSSPLRYSATCGPTLTRFSTTRTLHIAASNSASEPGRIAIHSSASSAVRERLGSTTTTFPPRSRMRSILPGKSGAVHMLPFDTYGLAPRTKRCSVRSRSGTGTATGDPKMRPAATWRGI